MSKIRIFILLLLMVCLANTAYADDLEFGPSYLYSDTFEHPFGVAVDETNQNLLVVDTKGNRVGWMLLADLLGAPVWTYFGYIADSSQPEALLDPQGIAVDSTGSVYVVDTRQNEVQRFLWDAGSSNYVYTPGFASDNPTEVAGTDIAYPRDIAVGPDGAVYLLDSGNKRILKADSGADTSWEVFISDPQWGNPYGITVGHDNQLYIADTDNHRVMRYFGASIESFGSFGTGPGQFRYPRDLSVDIDGRIYVLDSSNHRIEIINSSGEHVFALGNAPSFSFVQKIARDTQGRIFIADSDRNAIIAYLGEDVPVPFDLFIRDYVGDGGTQPSDPAFTLASPDILVRHDMDVDLALAVAGGLNSYAFQLPRYGEDNYVYVAVHNKGTQLAEGGFLRIYWADASSGLDFPRDYQSSGFYRDHTEAEPGNTYMVPPVDPEGGVRIIGPVLCHPPSPYDANDNAGGYQIIARVVHPFDAPTAGDGQKSIRDNNNVAKKPAKVIAAPFPTGEQNTLVVTAMYKDIGDAVDMASVETKITEMSAWMEEVSYGEVTVDPLFRGPVPLDNDLSYYSDPSRNLLIEMATEVLNKLLADEPELLDGIMPSVSDDIDRIVIVTNDSAEVDWATTGPWPYELEGQDRYLTVSVQNSGNRTELFSHGYCHQLGMTDLYAYEFVTLPFPYADGWDNMAEPFNGAHPLIWSKELSTWVTEHNSSIVFIPRPESGGVYNSPEPIPLYHQSTAAPDENIGIAFGLTNSVTAFEEETHFYYVEARDNTLDNYDSAAPGTGVLMYYVNEQTPVGHGPVMIRDHGTSPGHDLTLAAIPVTHSEAPEGTGIVITVNDGAPEGPDYFIDAVYEPPITHYDVYINKGDPTHISPDIWVQKQPYEYDETSFPADPEDRLDEAIGGQENRIWAFVSNHGPADAYNVDVLFHISEPYHTVGGVADFEFFKNKIIPQIPSGESRAVYVTWSPEIEEPHSCVRVTLQNLFDDTDSANNDAQQNMKTEWSTHNSPYTSVSFPFQIKNGESVPQLIYFRSDGLPADWHKEIVPPKAYLAPGESIYGVLNVTPPEEAPECTSYDTQITAWTPRGDTLVKLGGTSLIVNLGKTVEIDMQVDVVPCEGDILEEMIKKCCEERRQYCKDHPQECRDYKDDKYYVCSSDVCPCMIIQVHGCTNPPIKNQEIEVRYRDEEGNPQYHFVTTDEHGCFSDFLVVTDGGTWNVNVHVDAGDCVEPADEGTDVDVPIEDPQQDPDDDQMKNPLLIRSFTRDINGKIRLLKKKQEKCPDTSSAFCKVEKSFYQLELDFEPQHPCDVSCWKSQKAVLRTDKLAAVFVGNSKQRGYHRAEARITTEDGTEIFGILSGMININAHRLSGDTKMEPCNLYASFDGQYDGYVIKGDSQVLGKRMFFDYSFSVKSKEPFKKGKVEGVIKGAEEKFCRGDTFTRDETIDKLMRSAKCFVPVSEKGEGVLRLKKEDKVDCLRASESVFVTQHSMHVALSSNKKCDLSSAGLYKYDLVSDNLVHNFEKNFNSRGHHKGDVELRDKAGRVVGRGKMEGFTHVKTHMKTSSLCLDNADFEGMLSVNILRGSRKGAKLLAFYAGRFNESDQYKKLQVKFILEGAALADCGFVVFHKIPEKLDACSDCAKKKIKKISPELEKKLEAAKEKFVIKKYGDPKKIDRISKKIADIDKDGNLSLDEFSKFSVIKNHFTKIDKDQSKTINQEEIIEYNVSTLMKYYFKLIKPDSKGALKVKDILKQFPVVAQADADGDKRVTRKELKTWLTTKNKEFFQQNDTNQNGNLDLQEYHKSKKYSGPQK